MQDEQYVGSAGRPVPPEGMVTPSAAAFVAGADGGSALARPPRVESVPSDQLWRAAVLAARQAALTAAELRRALDAATGAAE